MITSEQVALFALLVRGRSDVYARYWEKDGRSGYSPAYAFDWNKFMAHKRTGGSIKTFENKTLLPLTAEVLRKHLGVQMLAGVYPILEDDTSYFLAADFDGDRWFADARAYVEACAMNGLTAYLEKSKSGNGGHVWIFFADAYPCYKSRRIGLELIRKALRISEFEKEVSFDRLFPNQDAVPSGGFGNLIALPLHGAFADSGTMVFINSTDGSSIDDQWAYLSNMKRHGARELDAALSRLEGNEGSRPDTKVSNGALTLNIRSRIELDRGDLAPSATRFVRDKLNLLNVDYLVRKRMGKSVHQTRKYFKLVDEVGDSVFIPRGFREQLSAFLRAEHIPFEIAREHATASPSMFSSSISLTEPQSAVVQAALSHDEGVIVAPPGSGKTMMGLEIIARRGLSALVLVHRKELLEQWVERIQTFLNIPKAKIGRFSGTQKKVGEQITVGLLQSFARAKDVSGFANAFGTIVVDECHHVPAPTFRTAIVRFNPRHLYGLTATPKRKWGDESLIHAYLGETIVSMEEGVRLGPHASRQLGIEVVVRETELEMR